MKIKRNHIRLSILLIILGVTVLIEILHLYFGNKYPSVHAVCPVGGLENLWAWFAGQSNLQKLFSGTMTLFFLTTVFAIVFRRSFCGSICPFGTLFELIGKLTRRKFTMPKILDRILRYLKYAVLVFITYMAWKTATLWISPYDPYAAFSHMWIKGGIDEYLIGFIILIVISILALFYDRFFCKYICPAGAFYGILSKISPLKIKRNPCINCNKCTKACPVNIDVAKCDTVKSAECIDCGKCIDVCPDSKKYLGYRFFGRPVKAIVVLLVSVLVFFGSIFVLDKLGLYQVSVPSIEQVEKEGKFLKIADLRGSMTIDEAAKYTGKSLSEFYEIMEIPSTVSKDIRHKEVALYVPGYDFHVIKAKKG